MALALYPALGPPGEAVLSGRAQPLWLRRLSLSDFRSYAHLRLEVDSRPVVLSGPNGAGKTNLLEAISLLAPGRGLRRARLGAIDRTGGGPWAVAARLEDALGCGDIGTGRVHDGDRERRAVRINGAPAESQAALAEVVSVLWLTPDMDRLFQEGTGARRRFLDRLVLAEDPAHAGAARDYAHALRERGRLLREGRREPAWLGA
ncbi:MAG: AAA family ATPase, partial [Geminicoccaceae bacterium]